MQTMGPGRVPRAKHAGVQGGIERGIISYWVVSGVCQRFDFAHLEKHKGATAGWGFCDQGELLWLEPKKH